MKTVKEIKIIFENCESFTLQPEDVGQFQLSGITPMIQRIGCNCVAEIQLVKHVEMELFKEANMYYHFWDEEPRKKFDRLMNWNDITGITLTYDDDSKLELYVSYKDAYDGLGADNLNQHVYESSLGNLYIVVDETKTIEDCFQMSLIENEDEMSFMRDMVRE